LLCDYLAFAQAYSTTLPYRLKLNYSRVLYKPVVLNICAEGNQIQTYDFVREPHCKNFNTSESTLFVLLQNEVCCTEY